MLGLKQEIRVTHPSTAFDSTKVVRLILGGVTFDRLSDICDFQKNAMAITVNQSNRC